MAKKEEKKHDLRDDIYTSPHGTVTNTDERLAGSEPRSVDPENGNLRMVTPEVGGDVVEGQDTKG